MEVNWTYECTLINVYKLQNIDMMQTYNILHLHVVIEN